MGQQAPPTHEHIKQALAAFAVPEDASVQPMGGGLINVSLRVEHGGHRAVLQRVHPVFPAEIHHDIEAVTRRLSARGVQTPRLLPTRDGRLCAELPHGVWRLLTWIEGVSFATVDQPQRARSAAELLARFHSALTDCDHRFRGVRTGVHDTAAHLRRLREAVDGHGDHRLFDAVAGLSDELHRAARGLPTITGLPRRVVHGDPKFNNVLFDPTAPRAVCMVDLDTVGPMELHLELGDCFRSWCNPGGEDEHAARFDVDIYRHTVQGYLSALQFALTPEEQRALVHGVEWITVELAARFAADALREEYFGWDRERFPAAGEHNLARARGQWALHLAVMDHRATRAAVLEQALA